MDLVRLREFETLSPFEIKDELIKLAKKTSKTTQSAFLNAGRGNPNWIATTPREGFFLLGQFALTESTRVMKHPAGLGGMPQSQGIAGRLEEWLTTHADMPGAPFMASMVDFAVKTFGFEPDAFVHELVDSIIGDNYPVPDRMLVHNERIVHEYLMWAMCGSPRPPGKFDLYAVEGGTAAMCYIFKSLKANRLLRPGDTIALGTPIFTPYIEMTHLEDYALNVVTIEAPQGNRFQFTDAELKKLEHPQIKAFFLVNPGNPTGVALTLEPRKVKFIDRIVADSRDVALNHTAGLSLPQQVMMSLFSLAEMMDGAKRYQNACAEIVRRRALAMIEGLGIEVTPNPLYDAYYGLIDFEFWARKNIGEDAVQYLKKNVHPLDLAFRLAEDHGIVLLNGGGFEAPDWSLRVSLANLADDVYDDIGRGVRTVARGYRDAFEASKRAKRE